MNTSYTAVQAPERAETTTCSPLSLEARLAATDAAMTVRLEIALLRADVNAADASVPLDLADVITGPVLPPDMPTGPSFPTPAADVLQAAARHLRTAGWCRDATVDEQGATCLYGAIRAQSPAPGVERDALDVLLEAIRRQFPGADSIPTTNDRLVPNGWGAARLLDQAAVLADARGL